MGFGAWGLGFRVADVIYSHKNLFKRNHLVTTTLRQYVPSFAPFRIVSRSNSSDFNSQVRPSSGRVQAPSDVELGQQHIHSRGDVIQ